MQYKSRLAFAMICMVIVAACNSAVAFLVKPILDDIFINKDEAILRLMPLLVMVLYLLKNGSGFGQAYFMSYVGNKVVQDLRNLLFENIQRLSISYFHKEKTGGLMSRVTYDVSMIKNMVSLSITGALKDAFTIVGLLCVVLYRDWQLAFLALIVLPFAAYPIIRFSRKIRKVSTGYQESMGDLSTFLHEKFAGNKIVKAFGNEEFEIQRFADKTRRQFKLEMRSVKAKSLSSPVMDLLGGVGVALIIWYGGSKVISGQSTVGNFFSFMTAVFLLYDPLRRLTQVNNALQEGLSAVERVFEVIEMKSEIGEAENPKTLVTGAHRVVFSHVDFKYEDQWVLKDISLSLNPGQIVALVGMSGGGKTTMVNLVPRFYDVCGGKIEMDGTDIRELSISSLRSQIAMVTQEPILFNDTILENIAYGNRKAGREEIENAAKAAYAYDFIESLPKKFDTPIGELGSRLSGGEKQRICIARALLKNAPILILDEATSSLDSKAESLVQKALENLMHGRSTFVIAHRLSTIIHADRIVLISGGRVIEEGRHDELLKKQGDYFKLYNMQFKNNPLSAGGDSD
ncbi:MAG: ATP-binding cassette domain-containing protein [Desulfobacteraceae bacterium]|nr:ATP-binding cassette domain-containing protein [Desulfobacteraceae bacterium]